MTGAMTVPPAADDKVSRRMKRTLGRDNASERAKILAESADVKISGIKDINVVSSSYMPVMPRSYNVMAMAKSQETTPIETDNIYTRATVQITFNN